MPSFVPNKGLNTKKVLYYTSHSFMGNRFTHIMNDMSTKSLTNKIRRYQCYP